MEIETSEFEVRERVGLVALCCHMEHVDALLVLDLEVRSALDEQLYHLRVPMEGSEVQRKEPLLPLRRVVHPVLHHFLNLLFYVFYLLPFDALSVPRQVVLLQVLQPQICPEALLKEIDDDFSDLEGVVVG